MRCISAMSKDCRHCVRCAGPVHNNLPDRVSDNPLYLGAMTDVGFVVKSFPQIGLIEPAVISYAENKAVVPSRFLLLGYLRHG